MMVQQHEGKVTFLFKNTKLSRVIATVISPLSKDPKKVSKYIILFKMPISEKLLEPFLYYYVK